jgi:hypothetical protein
MNLSWQVKQLLIVRLISKFYPWKMPTELPKSFKLELLLEVLVVVNQRYLKILVLKRIQNGYQTNR